MKNIKLILAFFLYSCTSEGKFNEKNEIDSSVMIDSIYKYYPVYGELTLKILIENKTDRIEVYDTTNNLNRIQYYTNNILDTIVTYDGMENINSTSTFTIEGDEIVENTRIYFSSNMDTIQDKSYYYKISNGKKIYHHSEMANISFNINRPIYGEIIYVDSDYSNKASDLTIKELKEMDNDSLMTLYIPTDTLGRRELKFIISDCFTIGDSVIQCRQMKGVFKYEVIE